MVVSLKYSFGPRSFRGVLTGIKEQVWAETGREKRGNRKRGNKKIAIFRMEGNYYK